MTSQSSLRYKDITEVPKSLKRITDIKPLDLDGTPDFDPKSELQEHHVKQIIKAYEGLDQQKGYTEAQKL